MIAVNISQGWGSGSLIKGTRANVQLLYIEQFG